MLDATSKTPHGRACAARSEQREAPDPPRQSRCSQAPAPARPAERKRRRPDPSDASNAHRVSGRLLAPPPAGVDERVVVLLQGVGEALVDARRAEALVLPQRRDEQLARGAVVTADEDDAAVDEVADVDRAAHGGGEPPRGGTSVARPAAQASLTRPAISGRTSKPPRREPTR